MELPDAGAAGVSSAETAAVFSAETGRGEERDEGCGAARPSEPPFDPARFVSDKRFSLRVSSCFSGDDVVLLSLFSISVTVDYPTLTATNMPETSCRGADNPVDNGKPQKENWQAVAAYQFKKVVV